MCSSRLAASYRGGNAGENYAEEYGRLPNDSNNDLQIIKKAFMFSLRLPAGWCIASRSSVPACQSFSDGRVKSHGQSCDFYDYCCSFGNTLLKVCSSPPAASKRRGKTGEKPRRGYRSYCRSNVSCVISCCVSRCVFRWQSVSVSLREEFMIDG
jgi:hypothetical protein